MLWDGMNRAGCGVCCLVVWLDCSLGPLYICHWLADAHVPVVFSRDRRVAYLLVNPEQCVLVGKV
jgi:hypothetical protein